MKIRFQKKNNKERNSLGATVHIFCKWICIPHYKQQIVWIKNFYLKKLGEQCHWEVQEKTSLQKICVNDNQVSGSHEQGKENLFSNCYNILILIDLQAYPFSIGILSRDFTRFSYVFNDLWILVA